MSARTGAGPPPPRGAAEGTGRGRSRGAGDGAEARRLRALNEPRPVRVETDAEGRPAAVALPDSSRRGFHLVEAVRESWRIDDEWWRRPISRLYHDVVLEGGRLVTLYRDLADGGWYVQG